MAKSVLFFFAIVLVASVSSAPNEKACSPWLGWCQVYEHCCRGLTCATYMLKCIPTGGLIIPGKDNRPIGNGPFPPGSPYKTSTTPRPHTKIHTTQTTPTSHTKTHTTPTTPRSHAD